jgi:hypothetical protein
MYTHLILITVLSTIVGIVFNELIRPNELMQGYARFANMYVQNFFIKKLLICPWCIAGQLAMWQLIHLYLTEFKCLEFVRLSIISVCMVIYLTKKILENYG